MKKNILLILGVFCCFYSAIYAGAISQQTAQKVATNYYQLRFGNETPRISATATLKYTRTEDDGSVDYYVFDISPKGFVIVTADDNLEPVIAYSTESNFNINGRRYGVNDWMDEAAVKVVYAKRIGVLADARISNLWAAYKNGQNPGLTKGTTVGPLLATLWDQEDDFTTSHQSPMLYNNLCPYNPSDAEYCVTGCVATTMSQIMYYWKFPTMGIGSYSYDADDTYSGDSYNYGTQSVNFGTTTYLWTTMATELTTSTTTAQNNAVATLMYDAGVSVAMDYGDLNQGGSGAYVIQADVGTGSPCAQYSFVNYFGYNASTIQGLYESSYTTSSWATLLENELNNSRVLEYAGFGPDGGHTWVCDGYETSPSTMFHMNWGWSGTDNGYFAIGNLDPSPYTFNSNNEALIGIEPGTAANCSTPTGELATNIGTICSCEPTIPVTFEWAAMPYAQSYNFQYEVVGAGSWTTVTCSTNLYNAYLTPGSNYQWEVGTVCPGGSSTNSSATAFTTSAPSNCGGTPTGLMAGNIDSTSATLSWSPDSDATSYGIAWKAANDEHSKAVIGVTQSNYTLTNLSACTAYQFMVETICADTSPYSQSATFTTTGCPGTEYCASTAINTQYEYIKNVKLGAINAGMAYPDYYNPANIEPSTQTGGRGAPSQQISGNGVKSISENSGIERRLPVSGGDGYVNNTQYATVLVGGTTDTITLTPGFTGTAYNEYFTVYIDYNHNGVFEPGELVLKAAGKSTVSKSFVVPTTALNGPTRMRVQMNMGAYATSPCATLTYGQVQDFTVNITGNGRVSLAVPTRATSAGNDVALYPNPAQNNITVQFTSQNAGPVKMNVYDLTGQKVTLEETMSTAGQNIQNINTAMLTDGVYILEIENSGNIQRRKFIVSR